ncbi:pentapeptide repeat-containing protein [Streptomyces cavernicola]|uniref:Pentapeptide repeat-containing protein n=1 Tax=Streptomyces cavernicola TaxID=3043613 RepID=A0ABT6SHA8_9ACTN|nr:pentapeptide repeat-containing protein [Streptomyces sp. B-S-A6]MDI3407355.1 pentapeptide repeat-containing protein [Streptomyces sp. B-S-A6]
MPRERRTQQPAVKPARRPDLHLPPLRPYGDGELTPDGDYDGLLFDSTDLAYGDGAGARFLDCSLEGCVLDETSLRNARFIDSRLSGVRGVGTNLSGAALRDVEVLDARMGGVQLHGAVLERVVIRGGKVDYLNLRRAKLRDVVFEGVVLSEPDFGGASMERVSFEGCALRGVDLTGARLKDVDLRRVAGLDLARGDLAGAVISPPQLLDLAHVFAAQLGVRVED